MRIIRLPPDDWPLIAPIVSNTFGDGMPTDPQQTQFRVALDEQNSIRAFLRMERLYHMVNVYVSPFERHRSASLAREMITDADRCIPTGFSAIWITRKPYDRLAQQIGARDLGVFHVY